MRQTGRERGEIERERETDRQTDRQRDDSNMHIQGQKTRENQMFLPSIIHWRLSAILVVDV